MVSVSVGKESIQNQWIYVEYVISTRNLGYFLMDPSFLWEIHPGMIELRVDIAAFA